MRTGSRVRPARFADREGVVVKVNRADGEIGVRLGSPDSHSAAVWSRPAELTKLGHSRPGAAGGAE